MNRLKHYLLNMQSNTTTYKEMYDGKSILVLPNPDQDPEVQYDLYIGMRTYPAKSPILTNWHTVNRRSHGASPLKSWALIRLHLPRRIIACVLLYHILTSSMPNFITAPVPMTKTESIISINREERCLYATRRILLFVRRRIISAEAETRHICRTMTFPVLRKCVFASGCRYNCPKENSEKQFKCFAATCPPLWICLSRSLTS